MTNNLARRVWEHREGVADGFTKKYGLKRLVWAERHDDIRAAIQREHNLKHWPRAWKIQLIVAGNPAWTDLYDRRNVTIISEPLTTTPGRNLTPQTTPTMC